VGRFFVDVQTAYRDYVLDDGKEAQALILVAFLVTFLLVRFITHSIRAGRFRHLFHNITGPGGTHFHHLVPGILLLLITGYLGIGLDDRGLAAIVACLFGVGAALTLDEFALWLHLEDVYWAKEGRQSIDAVTVAATLVLLGILGGRFWIEVGRAMGRLLGGD
jgi:hypothetical protein